MKIPTEPYRVKKGDNLTKITKALGYPAKTWRKIYDLPENASFRTKRPDPNLIYPEDKIFVPKWKPKDIEVGRKNIENSIKIIEDVKKTISNIEKEINNIERLGSVDKKKVILTRKFLKEAKKKYKFYEAVHKECQAGVFPDEPSTAKFFACTHDRRRMNDSMQEFTDWEKTLDQIEKDFDKNKKESQKKLKLMHKKIQKKLDEWSDAEKEINKDMKKMGEIEKLIM